MDEVPREVPVDGDAEPSAGRSVDGDASEHLDELVVDATQLQPTHQELGGNPHDVQLVGPHLRLAGRLRIGAFRRLSDYLNHNQDALVVLHDVTVLRRNGIPTRVSVPSLWVGLDDVTLVAEMEDGDQEPRPEFVMPKDRVELLVVTPGHTLTGGIHLTPGAELSLFIESSDPRFLPMTDVRTRSLADRRVIARYPFAMLNRRHIVATSALPPGMAPGRTVL